MLGVVISNRPPRARALAASLTSRVGLVTCSMTSMALTKEKCDR
jgi:hypothetical protein